MMIAFSQHALHRMAERQIPPSQVLSVLETGVTVENYPEDKPFASRLVLGWVETLPIHIVVAYDNQEDKAIIVTVYVPTRDHWETDYKTRKKGPQ